jgi:hypothetical protein
MDFSLYPGLGGSGCPATPASVLHACALTDLALPEAYQEKSGLASEQLFEMVFGRSYPDSPPGRQPVPRKASI